MKVLYTTQATSTGGRSGSSKSADGVLAVTLTTPKELGGDGATGTNPEQLFAAGYSACFLGALKFVAGKAGVKIPAESTVTGKVGIGPRDDGQGFGIEAALTINVPGVDRATVE
jgi:lipoyl-dependent peroxiredoxin